MRRRSEMGTRVRRVSVVGALLFSTLVAHFPARAQEASGDQSTSNAAALFERGRAAAAERDWLLAFSLFERSFRMLPSYDTSANLGQAALKLERYADAADFLTYSLEHFPPSGDSARRESIESLLEIALAEVGVVQITCKPPDAELLLDGERVRTINPNRWYLSPGRHIISARAKGYQEGSREIAVRARTNNDISLVLAPIAPTQPRAVQPAAQTRSEASWRDPVPIVLVGGGLTVAALGLGIGFQLLADSKESQVEEAREELVVADPSACASSGGSSRCSRIDTLATEADERRTVSFVGYGVATAALLATATLLLWSPSDGDKRSSFMPGLIIDAGSLRLSAEGRF